MATAAAAVERFGCEHGCGFTGAYAAVAEHETHCASGGSPPFSTPPIIVAKRVVEARKLLLPKSRSELLSERRLLFVQGQGHRTRLLEAAAATAAASAAAAAAAPAAAAVATSAAAAATAPPAPSPGASEADDAAPATADDAAATSFRCMHCCAATFDSFSTLERHVLDEHEVIHASMQKLASLQMQEMRLKATIQQAMNALSNTHALAAQGGAESDKTVVAAPPAAAPVAAASDSPAGRPPPVVALGAAAVPSALPRERLLLAATASASIGVTDKLISVDSGVTG